MRPWMRCISLSELIQRYAAWYAAPYGADVENWRHGSLCSLLANLQGNKTTPQDFYPPWGGDTEDEPATEQSPEHLLGMFRSVATNMNKGAK